MLLNTSNSVLKKEHIYSLFTPNGCISMSTWNLQISTFSNGINPVTAFVPFFPWECVFA